MAGRGGGRRGLCTWSAPSSHLRRPCARQRLQHTSGRLTSHSAPSVADTECRPSPLTSACGRLQQRNFLPDTCACVAQARADSRSTTTWCVSACIGGWRRACAVHAKPACWRERRRNPGYMYRGKPLRKAGTSAHGMKASSQSHAAQVSLRARCWCCLECRG